MRIISTTTSIALGFAFIISSAVLAAHFFGLLPDRAAAIGDQRVALSRLVAAQCSAAADTHSADTLRAALVSLLNSNPDVASAGIRAPDGRLLVQAGLHAARWKDGKALPEAGQEIAIPILQGNDPWATVEIRFRPLPEAAALIAPVYKLVFFVAASGFLGSLFFLKKVLKHLDPSSVIPDRVRAMLDALAEGVIIMDNSEQVVMANEAFCRIAGTPLEKIQGRRITDLAWLTENAHDVAGAGPWLQNIKDGVAVRRHTLRVTPPGIADNEHRILVVNAVGIQGTNGARRGILTTFDDVTTVEAANSQLRFAMDELARSRDEIERKNSELETLASRDPLTGCFNRRAFLRSSDQAWAAAAETRHGLGCIMIDIDFFKKINDQYGHIVGDQVLRQMGQLLQSACRGEDLVCRYGGEEFCVLLPQANFEGAHTFAERLREKILATPWPISSVTASIGVSGQEAGAQDMRTLLDQADKSLYAAKRNGRNRVVCWGDPLIDAAVPIVPDDRRGSAASLAQARQVTLALFQALHARDKSTAEHSRRVAELASLVGKTICGPEDAEYLFLGALLHDMGKLAIPDAILRKPGPLTKDEWDVMRGHEHLGAELVEQAINNPTLTAIVQYHHAWYAGTPDAPEMPRGEQIPRLCRVLLIADAYDALVSDRVYRAGTSHEKACAELRRCAGTQFDAEIVEAFIHALDAEPNIREKLSTLAIGYQSRCVEKLQSEIDGIMGAIASVLPNAPLRPARNCCAPDAAPAGQPLSSQPA